MRNAAIALAIAQGYDFIGGVWMPDEDSNLD
jgi:hypothetical protein